MLTVTMIKISLIIPLIILVIIANVNGRESSNPPQNRNVLILIGDDAGFETQLYNNPVCQTPHLNELGRRSVVFENAFTSVSSCSPSRSAILTGLPQHENGMYGLHQGINHFNSFDQVQSLPRILKEAGIKTGIVGKKHVGPEHVYPFDYEKTEQHHSILQVGRNITNMRLLVREFLSGTSSPFLLYIGFHDPHRCGHTHPQYGQFCEKFGNGDPGMGRIPDWTPVKYRPDDVIVPPFVQDTPVARGDIAAQYTTISRLDQGIGVMMKELEAAGHTNDTLILYTSDNGVPFPNGRTNLYDSGSREPFLLSSPLSKHTWGKRNSALVNLIDIVPTVLDWFSLPYPKYKLQGHHPQLTGKSLLPLLENTSADSRGYDLNQAYEYARDMEESTFSSHSLHENVMYYPIRTVRTRRYRLLQNHNYKMPFPIDKDFFISPTFQDLLNRTRNKQPLRWFKTLQEYYYRDEWELFDVLTDPDEVKNLAYLNRFKPIRNKLTEMLNNWQNVTFDPWICGPGAVLQDSGAYKAHPQCFSLDNDLY